MAKKEIDWNKVFFKIKEITGLPVTFNERKRRWYGSCYYDGSSSDRWDKLMIRQAGDGAIQLLEQGNDGGISLWSWMKKYGGCSSDREVAIKLSEMTDGVLDIPPPPPPKPSRYVQRITFNPKYAFSDNLFLSFCRLFKRSRVIKVFQRYNVTANMMKSGKITTCFWYLDKDKNICHDKRILYLETGKRDKTYGGGRFFKVDDGYTHRCYFGEHILPDYKGGKKVILVESEKTALLVALYFNRPAIACGGKNNLLKVDPDWILFPDRDCTLWGDLYPNQVFKWWEFYPEYPCGEKDDIGDYIIWKMKGGCK